MVKVASLKKETREEIPEFLNYCPDDSAVKWKQPFLWQKTPKLIHDLVMTEVGSDEISPRGFQVLIKLWTPPEQSELGWDNNDHYKRGQMQMATIGKVLRMGAEAFCDIGRFPLGPRITYGEWAIFRGTERQKIEVNGIMLAFVNDDRFMGVAKDPTKVQTSFDLEHDWSDQ
jgi:hypothetical protein